MARTTMRLVNGKLKRIPLPDITNCNDCGACCRHMGTPPGFALFYPTKGEIADWAKETEDYKIWRGLPDSVKAELAEYYRAVDAGEIEDRTRDADTIAGEILAKREKGDIAGAAELLRELQTRDPIACLWYDEANKRCAHYEHRPEVCRTAINPGDRACLATRKRFSISLPVVA